MKLFNRPAIALFGLVLLVAATPNSAHARGSVHVDVPGFSIGWHDNDRRYRKRHYRSSRRHYDNYYYNDYRHGHSRRYNKRHYDRKRYYDNRYYDNNYYYGGQRYYPRDRYYDRPTVVEICPIVGYSRYRDRNRSCYQHKDHYHCE